MKKILILTVCVVFLSLMFAGCGVSGSGALVGTWILEDGQPFNDVIEYYRLSKDGKGIVDIQNEISWKVENGSFVITYVESSKTYELDYRIQGKKLIISFGGKDHTYIKTSGNSDDFRKWRSSIEIDPVNDEKTICFRVVSSQGNYRLQFRKTGKKSPEMWIYWGDDIEISRANVTFRIDEGDAESSRWDLRGKSFTLYPGNVLQLAKRLLDARKVAARCSSTKSEMTAIFDVTGFKDIVENYNDDLNWF